MIFRHAQNDNIHKMVNHSFKKKEKKSEDGLKSQLSLSHFFLFFSQEANEQLSTRASVQKNKAQQHMEQQTNTK